MKKLFPVIAVVGFILSLSAGSTQVAIFGMGKAAHLNIMPPVSSAQVRSSTGWDRKTGEKTYTCLYFSAVTKSTQSVKKVSFKFEAEKCELSLNIGHKRADKMLWTSIKIDGKELIKDPKKGEVIGIKRFPLEKVEKKKTISFECSYRMASKKDLQANQKSAKKSTKKSAKKSGKKSK